MVNNELVSRLRDADMGDDNITQKLLMDAADEIERLRGWLEAIKYRSHGHSLAMLMANDALRGCVITDPDESPSTRG